MAPVQRCCMLNKDILKWRACIQESLRKTAEQYHLANQGSPDAADGMHATASEDLATTDSPSVAGSSAPDYDADIYGSGCENTGKRRATQTAADDSCKMQKLDTTTDEQNPDAGVLCQLRILLFFSVPDCCMPYS